MRAAGPIGERPRRGGDLGPLSTARGDARTESRDARAARRPASRARRRARILAALGAPVLVLGWAGAALALPALPSLSSLPSWPSLRTLRSLPSPFSLLHPHLPAWVERWLYNPRERTAAAIAGVARGDAGGAVAAADTALRLAPGSPATSYNAGTARLAAGDRAPAGGAARLLEQAVKAAGPDLAVAASYNLGNARLAAGDFAGAVEAFKQALRAAPGNADAKFNLELALREQRRHPPGGSQAVGPRGGGSRPREGERQQTAGQGGSGAAGANPQPGQPAEQRASSLQQGRQQGQTGQAESAQGLRGQPSPLSGRQPLAGYQDQPEMSASEAAAVLEAVENLERQQRRLIAARLAHQRAAHGEDW